MPNKGSLQAACVRGHDTSAVGSRYAGGACKECIRIHYSPRYRERRRENSKKYYQSGPGKISYRNQRWKKFGILNDKRQPFTTIDYDRAYQIQQGKCLGCHCHQSEIKDVFCADHDHKTGLFRGLLCRSCNGVLGYAKDRTVVLGSLIEYLMKATEAAK